MGLLPLEKSQKNTNLSEQVILVYGRPKIGKSTLCSCFKNALFLATEPGLNHLEVFQINITSWKKFLEACSEIAKGQHKYETIIVDTVDNLVNFCSNHVCEENNIEYPGDMPHGRGWALVTYELNRALSKLSMLPYGLIYVSHAKQTEVETKTKKYSRYSIDIGGKNQSSILKAMDIILFMDSEMKDGEEVGVVRTKPSLYWDAGDKSKLLPTDILFPPDKPEVAFDIIKKSFKEKEKK